ncbi:C-type lectin domain family 1 member A-like [Ochotona princeps]|uniref:C-type lectin domain family 1 member A-like n=1 Tax=Ochotona princeps TaxID=9978 RepID=UPI0027150A88|nr:C-type lectin domain family 1 member A-like [Ochotona princeps]
MSEVGAIYSNVRPQHLSGQRRRQHPETRPSKDLAASSPWKCVVVMLGLLGLVLLASVAFLITKLNQESFQAERYSANNSSNATETEAVWECPICRSKSHQYGENCYYFPRTESVWEDCSKHCIDSGLSFLRLDTEEEMNFAKSLSRMECSMQEENFWISSYYSKKQLKWVWLDGTVITLGKLQLPESEKAVNKCMLIRNGRILTDDCKSAGFCMCKTRTKVD